MSNYSNPEIPLSDADMAEIEDIFIGLMRARGARDESEETTLPLFAPPRSPDDLRSEWGIP
jgi:hypothetical protein